MSSSFDEPGSLMLRTIELAKAKGVDPVVLHNETGLPFYWLKKFLAGGIKNPSVNRVEYLFNQLSNKKLAI